LDVGERMALRMEQIEREFVIDFDAHVHCWNDAMIRRWEYGLAKIRQKCNTDLDVWAAVEVVWANADPLKLPTRDDALGIGEGDTEILEYVVMQINMLRALGTKRIKKTRDTDWDSKMRSAIVDTLLKALSKQYDFHGSNVVRQKSGLRDLLGKDGFDPVYETWQEVQAAIDNSFIADLERSVLVMRPRKGKWAGMGSDRKKWQKYQQEARHLRNVNRFLDDWSLNLAGQKPQKI